MGLAILLHALLLVAAVYGWMLFRSPPRPTPTLAIEATVVDARTVAGVQRAAPPPPAQPPVPQEAPPEPQGPPPPSPEERAQREKQRAEERQKADAAAEQKAAEEKADQQAAEESRKADEQRAAEAKRKAAEAKAVQEKKSQEAAQAREKAEEAQEAAEREADLKRSLASEEHAAASSGPALASWQAKLTASINRNWLRPPTARAGIQCMLYVTQEPGGVVTQVKIGECNGDQAVRESIEAAVYRASPLPPPPDPALFDRNLKINFRPD